MTSTYDAIVVGAGPAGLACGLALAHCGLSVAVIGPKSDPGDGRTAALFKSSVDLLKRLGAWTGIEHVSQPLEAIRLIDATGALFKAPEVTFWSREIGHDVFGYNVPTAGLAAALDSVCADKLDRIVTAAVTRIEPQDDKVGVVTQDGTHVHARLVAGADGRNSTVRAASGIETQAWSYPQAALVTTFTHTRPHQNISTEFHRRAGPLTVVPMPGSRSSLVWVETPHEAGRLAALDDVAFTRELTSHTGSILGRLHEMAPRRVFPLAGQSARTFAAKRMALIGEAAHIIPPIGAQGLNLSLRDAATLAELAGEAASAGHDPGDPSVLEAYTRRRHGDVTARVWSIDLMNRSLLSDFVPVHLLRGAGLAALKAVGPLRHLVMREGMAPSFATPRLMQG